MEFLRESDRFSFLYNGKDFREYAPLRTVREGEGEIVISYRFEDGLLVTNVAKKHEKFGAWEWVNTFENTGRENTGILSEILDSDVDLPMAHRAPRGKTPWLPSREHDLFVLNPLGSSAGEWDFYMVFDDGSVKPKNFLYPDSPAKKYAPVGGRSSDGIAPFFHLHQEGKGYVIGLGWSGQWQAEISRSEDAVHIKSKIEDTHFLLYPGEKVRTSSILILPYEGTVEDGQNLWRRLIREEIAPVKSGCEELPLALGIWPGTPSEEIIARTKFAIGEKKIPYNYLWNDAGWCGRDTLPSRNEYCGDWAERVGDWEPSPHIHPNGLCDVAETIHGFGGKYILWFEPERVRKTTRFAKEHPEFLLSASCSDPQNKLSLNYLYDLGNEEAWQHCFDLLSGIIERVGVDLYRQDFNFSPLPYWRANDTPDRVGITEIKHITGLYRLWDALREKFPGLLIDNCASGGRRWDVESLRRSIALWRTDAQCPADPDPEVAQANLLNFAYWIPYAGTGTGRVYDTYRVRSTYAPSLSTTFSYSLDENFGADEGQVEWLRARCEEYLRIRPYFDGDVYHLTKPVKDETSWCAVQWNRPERGDGMIQVFRRARSPYPCAELSLCGIDPNATYRILDLDGGERTVEGRRILEEGFSVSMPEKRSAKIFLYEKL